MIDRRFFPRYSCEMQLKINTHDEQGFIVEANEISEAGLSFKITLTILNSLFNIGCSMEIGDRFVMTIPADNQFGLDIECQIMHLRRLSQENYQMGVWFGQLQDNEQAIIRRLVNDASSNHDE